ncbi:MAG: hypothetical protein VB032_09585, partial [Burkholderiaceae bacterium]|nr:hypothetical protein [Burkholderiaceae bacterium]
MSICKVKKDHLPEHASLELVQPILEMPVFAEDPLKFWTLHPDETQRLYVDLSQFAVGKEKKLWNEFPFTGRPQLIRQLSPMIQELTTGLRKASVRVLMTDISKLWRILDQVEQAAKKAGQHMDRVEDVRQIAEFHREFLFRDCSQSKFNTILRVLNAARAMLGVTQFYWTPPDIVKPKRQLPVEDQSNDIRHALRHEWLAAHRRRQLYEEIQSEGFEPHEMQDVSIEEQERLLHNWRHYQKIQQETGKASLSSEELSEEKERRKRDSFFAKNGLSVLSMRQIAHPTRWEAAAAFHQCLVVTGWNQAVLESLDVTDPYFLVDHPRDEKRYLLTGTKVRARGAEMLVGGFWKTQAGPGYIIKIWLERTAPLRKQLQVELSLAREKYAQMQKEGASGKDLTKQLKETQRLQIAVKSVWIYADTWDGAIRSFSTNSDN